MRTTLETVGMVKDCYGMRFNEFLAKYRCEIKEEVSGGVILLAMLDELKEEGYAEDILKGVFFRFLSWDNEISSKTYMFDFLITSLSSVSGTDAFINIKEKFLGKINRNHDDIIDHLCNISWFNSTGDDPDVYAFYGNDGICVGIMNARIFGENSFKDTYIKYGITTNINPMFMANLITMIIVDDLEELIRDNVYAVAGVGGNKMHAHIIIKEKIMAWRETGYIYDYDNNDEIVSKLEHKIEDFVLKGSESEYANEFTLAQHGPVITDIENITYEENSHNDIWFFDIPSLKTNGFVNTRRLDYLTFNDVLNGLSNGYLAKLPEWVGYWKLHDDGKIYAHCGDNTIELANQFQENIFRTDWILLEEESSCDNSRKIRI